MTVNRSLGRAMFLTAVTILAVVTCRDNREATAPASHGSTEGTRPAAPPGANEAPAPAGEVLIGAGDIASCSTDDDEATAALLDGIGGTIFTLGDNAYASGTDAEYTDCYDPTWGRHKARTRPSAGDRDYMTAGAAGYATYFGAAAGASGKFYYSYDLGEWHVVVLNTKLTTSQTQVMLAWLKQDLKANAKACTIAYWHKPYISSAAGRDANRKPIWDLLYAYGAEIVLNADARYYERFAPIDPNEVPDASYGIRQFIVGTGGAGRASTPSTRRKNSEILSTGTPGVLKLTLRAAAYDWEFVPIVGMTFTDPGTGTCHGEPPPVAKPGGPYKSEVTVAFNGSSSVDLQEDYPLTYVWDFGDGSEPGTGDKPTHTYAADGVYTVTLVVTDSKGNVSDPATATVSIGNLPPTVDLFSKTGPLGTPVAPKLTFSDPGGADDGPWPYKVDWGDGTSTTGVASAQGTIAVSHVYPTVGKYLAVATVTDKDGGSGTDRANVSVVLPTGGNVIVAAGDIAKCNVSGGADNDELTAQAVDQVVAAVPTATVFTIGDNAYPNGTITDYTDCYEPTWGRHKGRTYAALGNHEYDTGSAQGSFEYFGERAGQPGSQPSCVPGVAPNGAAITCEGYYSLDIGEWHIVILNDNIPIGSSSGQLAWLRSDLTKNTMKCQLVIWHQPRFMSSDDGFNLRTTRKAIWDRLYAFGVEIALNAHQHFYERHHPMKPDGVRDDVAGVRQFMVGTGGESTHAPATLTFVDQNSVVRSGDFGVLKVTLHSNAYDWRFTPAPGYAFTDSGSAVCH
jgi:PKD repeat protein